MVVRSLICAAILPVLVLALIGCDSGDDYRKQLLEAIDKTDNVQSYQMTISSSIYNEEGALISSQDYEEKRASNGDFWDRSVLYRYDEHDDPGSSYWELIRIGNMVYCRDEQDGEWLDCSEPRIIYKDGGSVYSGTVIVENDTNKWLQLFHWLLIDEVLAGVDLDGMECTYYRGTVDMESYMRDSEREYELPEYEPPVEIPEERLEEMQEYYRRIELAAELWIDGDNYIRQIKTEQRSPYRDQDSEDDNWHTMRSTFEYSGFGEAITIIPP